MINDGLELLINQPTHHSCGVAIFRSIRHQESRAKRRATGENNGHLDPDKLSVSDSGFFHCKNKPSFPSFLLRRSKLSLSLQFKILINASNSITMLATLVT